ncbi:microcephalin [Gadus macrocephalus]|uniref:microcephalin n=1 Tax=Gadus macrocephalus TaxID=80720 RepID=UPI0028CBAB48|nr:microcephalin [Gadus macrocephalus]
MARSNEGSSILKDVVAYVDVWSSSKTENISKPFIDELKEMGAEVSKTFKKHVTHVVFKDGHQSTWNKARKIGAKLVSVLWVDRCKEEAKLVDEELFPGQNDEANRLIKKRTHRCMQPKDSAEKTPENNTRMKKKLDKMIKDLAPHYPLFPDVSPYIIDQENGIVYSPSLKRSDSMARRLKEMREKRESPSPTASQEVEAASSSPAVKPCFGFSPTILKLLEDDSDEEASSPTCSPHLPAEDRGGASLHKDTGTPQAAERPWLSPCSDVPKRKSMSHFRKLKSGDGLPEGGPLHRMLRRSSMRIDFFKTKSGSEVPCQDTIAELPEKPKLIQSQLKFTSLGDLNPSSCLSVPAVTPNTQKNQELSKGAVFKLKKADPPTPKNKRRASSSASSRKSTLPIESLSVVTPLPEGEADGDFEDYFSPANQHPIQKVPSLPWLSKGGGIQPPFQRAPVPGKTSRRSETSGPNHKKRRPNESQSSIDSSDVHDQPTSHPHVPVPVPSLTKSRLKSVPKMDMDDFVTQVVRHRIPSNPTKGPQLGPIRGSESHGLQVQPEGKVCSQDMESGGSQQTVAAGRTGSTSADEASRMKMEQSKATRTLVTTSMSTDTQKTVTEVVKLLGGFSVVDLVCETTTHVVSGGQRRTMNVLLGIARGCWILSFEWMLRSLEQRRWLPEEPYELSERFPAAPICRLQQHLSAGEHQQDLFHFQPAIFVSQQSQPPPDSLVELIQLCGGTVCKTVRQAGLCVGPYSGRRPEGCRNLSEQWVLDCITQLKPLSYENYNLE